jgi:hypothetical protein
MKLPIMHFPFCNVIFSLPLNFVLRNFHPVVLLEYFTPIQNNIQILELYINQNHFLN